MFDLYGLNGEKKLSNIGQCGRVETTRPITDTIIDSNLIGASLVFIDVQYLDIYYATFTIVGTKANYQFIGKNFTIYFDRAKGSIDVSTDVSDKTQVKFKGYSYIK